jgi:hypothetical protein
MRKILLFEPLGNGRVGHGIDNLIEDANLFKEKFSIFAFVNKNFDANFKVPSFIKLIKTCEFKKKNYTKSLFIYLRYFIKEEKLIFFLFAIVRNWFSIPNYFLSFYLKYKQFSFNENDIIVLESARDKDIELFYFIFLLEKKIPSLHIKVRYPPKKKKLKNFFYYSNKFNNNKLLNKKFFLYTEIKSNTLIIKKFLTINVFKYEQPYKFYSRKYLAKKEYTLGFLGESRNEKGFYQLPELIKKIQSIKNINFKFIIQVSKKIYENTIDAREEIMKLSKNNKNIKIFIGHLSYLKWRNLLKKIDIMPIIYNGNYFNSQGSGILNSSLSHEIPVVIPSDSKFLKKNLKFKCFCEAKNIDEYAEKCILISKNYKKYLFNSKKQSNYLKKFLLEKDSFVKNILIYNK